MRTAVVAAWAAAAEGWVGTKTQDQAGAGGARLLHKQDRSLDVRGTCYRYICGVRLMEGICLPALPGPAAPSFDRFSGTVQSWCPTLCPGAWRTPLPALHQCIACCRLLSWAHDKIARDVPPLLWHATRPRAPCTQRRWQHPGVRLPRVCSAAMLSPHPLLRSNAASATAPVRHACWHRFFGAAASELRPGHCTREPRRPQGLCNASASVQCTSTPPTAPMPQHTTPPGMGELCNSTVSLD